MSSPARDRLLRTLLPALALGVGYMFLAPRPDLIELEEKLGEARHSASHARPLAAVQRSERRLQARKRELTRALQALAAGTDDAGRMKALQEFVDLFERHQVALVDETPGGGEGFSLPQGLRQLREQVEALQPRPRRGEVVAPLPSRQVWRLRVRGSYLSVLAALEALAEADLVAIPLSVGLEQLDRSGLHAWALVVWA